MNTLDLIVIGVVVLSALFAFLRGFAREVLSIAAWIGAAALAYYGYPRLLPTVARFVANPLVAQLVTAGVLFVVSLLVFSIVVGIVSVQVRESGMSSVDRSLGLVFGLVRGALVVCLGYLVAVHLIEPNVWPPKSDELPPWIAEARLRPYLEQGAKPLRDLIPPQLIDKSAAAAAQATDALTNPGDSDSSASPFDALREPSTKPRRDPGSNERDQDDRITDRPSPMSIPSQ